MPGAVDVLPVLMPPDWDRRRRWMFAQRRAGRYRTRTRMSPALVSICCSVVDLFLSVHVS
jgi:hypothetical protein